MATRIKQDNKIFTWPWHCNKNVIWSTFQLHEKRTLQPAWQRLLSYLVLDVTYVTLSVQATFPLNWPPENVLVLTLHPLGTPVTSTAHSTPPSTTTPHATKTRFDMRWWLHCEFVILWRATNLQCWSTCSMTLPTRVVSSENFRKFILICPEIC